MNVPHTQFNSAHERAQVAVYFLSALLVLLLFDLLLDFILIVFLPGTVTGALIELREMNWFDNLRTINYLLSFSVFIGAAVSFLMWLYRAYQNLLSLGAVKTEYPPSWAVGGFFIPFANLFVPYKAVREIWVRSGPKLKEPGEEFWQKSGSSSLIEWWWGLWLVSNIINRVAGTYSGRATTADQLFTAAKLEIVSDGLYLAAGVLAIMVIRGIDRRQELRSKSFQESSLPPPPPTFEPQQA